MKKNEEKSAPKPEVAQLNEKIEELTNDLQRTRADFENYRKQMDSQKTSAINLAKLDTVAKVLPLLDDIERAIASTAELQPLAKTLEKTVKELGLEKINSKPGTEFNPNLHEAVLMEEGEGDKEVIAETMRTGYLYDGEILRPAMAKIKTA